VNLAEAIALLSQLPPDDFICARRPWGPQAEALLVTPTDDDDVPAFALHAGFDYFLGVSTALELTQDLQGSELTLEELVEALTFYIENDAYPAWALEKRGPPSKFTIVLRPAPLVEVLRERTLDVSGTLFVQRPWAATAMCIVVEPDPTDGLLHRRPANLDPTYRYFIEVEMVDEIRGWLASEAHNVELVDAVIHYAEHDAFPWPTEPDHPGLAGLAGRTVIAVHVEGGALRIELDRARVRFAALPFVRRGFADAIAPINEEYASAIAGLAGRRVARASQEGAVWTLELASGQALVGASTGVVLAVDDETWTW
jgi:hypothetical protein